MNSPRNEKKRKKILIICPTLWDIDELNQIEQTGEYEFIYWPGRELAQSNPKLFRFALTNLQLLDVIGFINKTVERFRHQSLDGVISTDDHLGCAIASAVADKLNLPAPAPESILTCQHKLYSRIAQKDVVPHAAPEFWTVSRANLQPAPHPSTFPFFIKPVRGTFSILSKKITSEPELTDLIKLPLADRLLWNLRLRPFNKLLRTYTNLEQNADLFLAEELLMGRHVSLEGYCYRGKIRILGFLDAHMYAGTNSFKRFDYPSNLSESVKERMSRIAVTIMSRLNFDNGLFEIEMFYDDRLDSIKIIEINPRMCAQFADLLEKVDGVNSYNVQLAVASGESPHVSEEQGKFNVASSFVLRVFNNAKVIRLPNEEDISRVKSLFPDVRVRLFCREGDNLTAKFRQLHDMESIRIGAINLGGKDFNDLVSRFRLVMEELQIKLNPATDFSELFIQFNNSVARRTVLGAA